MDELLRQLMHLGLSEKEAAVYVSALELGPSTVQDISHKAKVNRATTYVMIESLVGRGLMSSFMKGKKRYFSAESPDRLSSLLRSEKQVIVEKEDELKKALPMLLALFNVEGAKPQIRYLEGPDGIQTVRDVFAHLEGEFVQIVALEDVERIQEIVEGREKHLEKLTERKAAHRALFVGKQETFDRLKMSPNGSVRLLPPEKFPIHADITVRGNHVFLYSYKSAVLAVIVVSQEIADSVRALFDLAWEGASNYPTHTS